MKKTAIGLSLILALLLSYGIVFVDLVTANPVWATDWPWEPITTPPSISVSSPVQNAIYNSTSVSLNFTVTKPNDWFGLSSGIGSSGNYIVFGKIKSVYYAVDGGKNTTRNVDEGDLFYSHKPAQRAFGFSFTLNLTSGQHKVTVGVKADTYYIVNPFSSPASIELQSISEPINFSVVLLQPVVVAPENRLYNESSVPLRFNIDMSASSWVGYSLDGKDNFTITGNTTLTGLSNGEHYITLFANDTFGNFVAPQTVNFIVALSPETKSFPIVAVASVLGVSAVVVIAGLIVYFKKRKH